MKKRILYIILGVMLLSLEGMGQFNFSLATGSNAKPLYNCNDVTFDYSNSSGQPVRLYIYYKLNSSDLYTQIPGYTTISNGFSSNYGYSISGFYKAEFKNSSGTSTLFTSSEYEVEIRPTPSSPVITSNSPVCEGATLTLNTTAVSGGTFSWTGVNGFSGSGVSPNIPNVTAASTGNYSATVTVNGCTSEPSNILSATVNVRPTATIIASNVTICEGDNVVVDMNVTATGTWSITVTDGFVNGTGSGLKSFVIYPTTNKTYSILNAVDINCPSISSDLIGSITVSVDALSVGGTIAGSTTVCSGTNSATLTLSGNTGSVTKWQSSTDAVFTTPADILTTTSSYNVSNLTSKLFYRAVVKNGVCAATNSSNADVSVDALSVGGTIAGSTTVCTGTNSATLTLSGNTGSVTKWQSSTDAVFTTPADILTTTSSYNVSNLTSKLFYRAVVKNGVCAATNSSNADVSVDALSVGGTIAGSTTVCSGTNSATLTLSGNTGSVTKWQSSTDAVFATPADILTTTSSYNASNLTSKLFYRAVVKNGVCAATNSSNADVSVDALSVGGTIAGSTTVCTGTNSATLTLSGNTGSVTKWQSSTDAVFTTPADILTTTSSYNASNLTSKLFYRAVVKNGVCAATNSSNADVNINPLPAKPTLTSQAICEGATATITGPTGTYTYTWQVPTGVATSTTKSVSTNKAGTYTLTITDVNSCTSEAGTATVTVNQLPAKPTLTSQAICEGTTATITGPSGTYTYTWQVPTGVATSTTKSVITSKAGTYTLTITDVNSCTSEAGTATVTVNPLPAKPTLTSQAICEGTTATITGPSGTYTYTWQVPTGVATSTTKSVSTNKAGTYSLTITDAYSCTSEVGTATVSVNALPPKPTLTSPVICEGATATVTMSTPTGTNTYTYNWRVPTGVATSTSNSVTTTKAGTYSLSITDANTCTSEVGIGTVTVNPLPTLKITNPSAVCAPGTVDLTATAITAGSTSSLTYTYFTDTAATISLTTARANTISTTGAYYIKGTTALNCSAIKAVNATVNPIPTFTISSPSVCLGNPLTITANPTTGAKPDYNYIWQVPSGVTNPGNVSSFPTTTAGVYTVTIKNKITNCESATLNNTVSFYPIPTAAAIVAPANKVIVNQTLNLTAAASGGTSPYRYTWIPNPTMYYSISGQENAVFNALNEKNVKIKYQVKDANNCEANSTDFEITIESEQPILIFPNAFTPNGDGNNDIFKIASSNTLGKASFLYFEIYNRNGQLMGKRYNSISDGWDGKYKDIIQDMGIYFVKLAKLDKDGKQVIDNAQFYLLK